MSAKRKSSRAGRVWDGYMALVEPMLLPAAEEVSRHAVQHLVGFWVLFHLAGDLDEMIAAGLSSRSSAYRNRREFLRVFGTDVDDFLPDLAAPIRLAGMKAGPLSRVAAG